MGTSTHTINTLFKRKSLFKPKSQEGSSPKCQSRLVAPHQEPFAPMFQNHTGSSRTVASSWLLPGLGGRGPGSLVSGERARIAPQRHGIISRQCQRDRTKPWRNPDNPGRSISTQNLPWAPPPILYIPLIPITSIEVIEFFFSVLLKKESHTPCGRRGGRRGGARPSGRRFDRRKRRPDA